MLFHLHTVLNPAPTCLIYSLSHESKDVINGNTTCAQHLNGQDTHSVPVLYKKYSEMFEKK